MASRAGTLRSPETPSMPVNSTRENRETSGMSVSKSADRAAKAKSHTAGVHVPEESDGRVVPTKGSNKSALTKAPAESLEGRRPTKENSAQRGLVPDAEPDMGEADRLRGVREAAQRDKRMRFTALLHRVTVERLRSSFFALKREAGPESTA